MCRKIHITVIIYWLALSMTSTTQVLAVEGPVLSGVPADATLECDQDLPAANVTATDNCDTDPDVTMTILSDTRGGVCGGVGQVVRQWTATDCSGNSVSAQQTVTFVDTTDPVLVGVPGDLTLECDQDLPVAEVTARDNCDNDPELTMTIVSDTRGDVCGGVGQVIREWTATDCAGNSTSARQVLTFVDTTPPTITPPPDLILGCYANTDPTPPSASDTCSSPTVSHQDRVTGDDDACPMDYTIARTWTATDECGNSATHVQNIIVDCPCGTVEVTKYTNGVLNDVESPGPMAWGFALEGPGIDIVYDLSPPSLVEFGFAELWPDDGTYNFVYKLCEVGIPAGWTLEWRGSPNPDATSSGGDAPVSIVPKVYGDNDDPPVNPPGYSNVFDPNYVDPPETFVNDTSCVNFVVLPGETEVFAIDNQYPGGEPRTTGYWKNWNTCTNGGQAETAANLGGVYAGVYLLDDVLNYPGIEIGLLVLGADHCQIAQAILDKRDIASLRKRASDAAYGLASQLLAALANLSAGAEICPAVTDAVTQAQALLESISFDGTGRYLRSRDALYGPAVYLEQVLDTYNKGELCDG